jgi:hypothetical protein
MPEYDVALRDKLDQTAAQFAASLNLLASHFEKSFDKVVRKTVLDLFGNIVRRSPVDTGTYRASHMIANHDPGPDEGIVQLPKDKTSAASSERIALDKGRAWTWKVGDGTIYIFNNVPYAEPLENGHSGQAPAGVYDLAMVEIDGIMRANIAKLGLGGLFR